jgi:tungstate transport system substrate-binding protein
LDVLIPAFEKATGYMVKTVAVGTGQALAMGAKGDADVLLVHAPAQEEQFVTDGNGIDRLLVANNHFMVVGPKDDPAGIANGLTAAQAFAKIAQSGSSFVSRGDGSGTETKELAIWKVDNITPKGQAWYIQSGQGMGATLQIASQKKAYTLTDDATFLANQANLDLVSLVKGDPVLLNIYHVISVNPAKFPKVNADGAKAFSDYVTGAAGQELIASYGVDKFGQPLFTADAGKSEDSLQ